MTTQTSIFTICTVQDLAHAVVLGESIQKHAKNMDFRILLADNIQNIPDNISIPFAIIPIESFAAPDFIEMKQKYHPHEFVRNLKPMAALYLLKQYNIVFYTDVQTVFYQSIESLETIASKKNILLCPQLLNVGIHPNEKESLNTGIFHAGFFGLKKSAETNKFLQWWRQNCLQKGFINLCKGQNAEQLWLEHVPAMFEEVQILKHPGINIGKWNEKERNIEQLRTDNQLISLNYSQSKFPKTYLAELKKFSHKRLKTIQPEYGIPIRKIKKTEIIAQKIRKINSLVDVVLDKAVALFIDK